MFLRPLPSPWLPTSLVMAGVRIPYLLYRLAISLCRFRHFFVHRSCESCCCEYRYMNISLRDLFHFIWLYTQKWHCCISCVCTCKRVHVCACMHACMHVRWISVASSVTFSITWHISLLMGSILIGLVEVRRSAYCEWTVLWTWIWDCISGEREMSRRNSHFLSHDCGCDVNSFLRCLPKQTISPVSCFSQGISSQWRKVTII